MAWADDGYAGVLVQWAQQATDLAVEVVNKRAATPGGTGGFQVLPKRWIVERTFAWINCF